MTQVISNVLYFFLIIYKNLKYIWKHFAWNEINYNIITEQGSVLINSNTLTV